ncbi:60S acidic ribosomal protein P2-alpha-like [Culex quinquefasciatus]|uniref:60S acidic ribosomal protein P2-alpha-like n=1 Tax=Culex quinquefasciatus TaxID=7176 RepID=UPI0018E3A32F|nr:60S acidic ribosomal protein P2-alpha-like [Culex quinquefasciatus]
MFLIAVPSNPDIEKVLNSVGIEAESTRVAKVVNDLKDKSVEELIATRREKLIRVAQFNGIKREK